MSKIEVDKIDPQSGTALEIGTSGDTVTIPSGVTLDASNATTSLPATVVTTTGTQTLTNKSIATTQLTGTITPSDSTVTTAKLADDAVTAAKINNDIISGSTELATAPADTDEFLVSDAGTLKRINYSLIKGGGSFEKISTTTISSSVASVDFNTLSTDYRDFRIICSDMRTDTHQQFPILKVKRAGQGSFDGGSNEYIYTNTGRNSQAATINEDSTGANGLRFLPANLARDASSNGVPGANMDVLIDCYNVHVTDSKFMIRASSTFIEGTYGRAAVGMTGGYRNALDAIIGIQIAAEGSTQYSSGTVTLYGRKI